MASEKIELVEHGDYITVSQLGSGWAAIHLRYDAEIDDYDVEQTGLGRYSRREDAVDEARDWAESEELPIILPEDETGNPWD